jgi:hypothetical protein
MKEGGSMNKYVSLILIGVLASVSAQAAQIRVKTTDDKVDFFIVVKGVKSEKYTVTNDKLVEIDMPGDEFQIKESKLLGARSCSLLKPSSYYGMGMAGGKSVVTFTFGKKGCTDDR